MSIDDIGLFTIKQSKTPSIKRPKSNEKTEKSNASTSTKDLPDDKSLNKVQVNVLVYVCACVCVRVCGGLCIWGKEF